jgi:hypothetical protein
MSGSAPLPWFSLYSFTALIVPLLVDGPFSFREPGTQRLLSQHFCLLHLKLCVHVFSIRFGIDYKLMKKGRHFCWTLYIPRSLIESVRNINISKSVLVV